MSKYRHKTVSSLQNQLKDDINNAIQTKVTDLCIRVVQDNLNKTVYESYTPSGDKAYDRTFELLDSVTVGDATIGYKYITFEVFMDTEKIKPYVTGDGRWNQHASVDPIDVSDYIPMWVEYGTSNSLWDREGAYYMENSNFELDGKLYLTLANELRKSGWKVRTF